VRFYLKERGIEDQPVFVEKILAAAKRSNRLLSEEDVLRMIEVLQERLKTGQKIEDDELEGVLS
jgi:hypothetical protein